MRAAELDKTGGFCVSGVSTGGIRFGGVSVEFSVELMSPLSRARDQVTAGITSDMKRNCACLASRRVPPVLAI